MSDFGSQFCGAGGRSRTGTGRLDPRDFKSRASTNSATPAIEAWTRLEATGGFEPPHKGFADLSLNHLGTSPRPKILTRRALKMAGGQKLKSRRSPGSGR